MDLMEYRKCDKCFRAKPFYEFYTDKDNYCIKCTKRDIEIKKLLNETSNKEDKQ